LFNNASWGEIEQLGCCRIHHSALRLVSLPQTGTEIEQFGEAESFESTKAALDAICPVAGSVTEVNHEQDKQPDLANPDQYDKGWFLKTELSDFEADKENLMEAEGYFEAMKKKAEKEHQKPKTKTQNQTRARAPALLH